MFSVSPNFSSAALKVSRLVFSYRSQACGKTFVCGGHGKWPFNQSLRCSQWGLDSATQQIPSSPVILHLYKCQRGKTKTPPGVMGVDQELKSMQSGGLPLHSVPFFTSLFLLWSVTLESKHYWHKTPICWHYKEAGLQPWAVSISQVLWALTGLEFCNFWSNFHGFCLGVCKKSHSDSVLQCCWVATRRKMPVFSLTIFTSTRWSIRKIFFFFPPEKILLWFNFHDSKWCPKQVGFAGVMKWLFAPHRIWSPATVMTSFLSSFPIKAQFVFLHNRTKHIDD